MYRLLVKNIFQPSIDGRGLRIEVGDAGEVKKLINDPAAADSAALKPLYSALEDRFRLFEPSAQDIKQR